MKQQDPGQVHTSQQAWFYDMLATGPATHILQLHMEGFSAARQKRIAITAG